MDKLFVFDTNENILAVLENKDGSNACPHIDTAITEQLNGEFGLEFQIPANHRDAQHVVRGHKIGLWDPEDPENFLKFHISKTDDEHGEGLIKTVICEHALIVEGNDDIVKDKRPSNVTADQALAGILTDTVLGGFPWKVGRVAQLGTATPENIYYESVMSGVQKIRLGYKTDYKPRIVVVNGRMGDHFIDLGPRGTETGRRIEYTKDLKQIKREVDEMGVKTALIGRGKGEESVDEEGNPTGGFGRRIDFSSVVWSVANGDPVDKPAGQIFVGDPNALAQFGHKDESQPGGKRHRLGNFEDPDETDPALLLAKTWDNLQTVNQPRASYTMTIVDLAELTGLDHQKIRLGDTVTVIDREFVPAITIKTRVIEIKRVIGEPDKTEIKLGNFVPLMTDEVLKIEGIERKINDRSGIWESGGGSIGPITNENFQDKEPTGPKNVTAEGLFNTIMVGWDYENDVTIGQYEVYASPVKGFTPDTAGGSNLVFRGLSSGYVHEPGANNQVYFRVRTVNRKGTPGPFSPEVSATTVQLVPDDFDQSLIPEFIDAGIIKQDNEPAGSNHIFGQLWIDTSKTPNAWNRWDGSKWVSLVPTLPEHVGAESQIYKQATAPEHKSGRLWLDTSKTPNVLYRSTGSSWAKVTPTTPSEIGAETAIYKQSTAPSHSNGRLWLDTSVTPNVLYRSTGSTWVKGSPTTAEDVGTYTFEEIDTALNAKASKTVVDTLTGTVESHETRISQTETDITSKASQTSVDGLTGRIETAESTISQHAGLIQSKVESTDFNALEGRVDTAESTISQHAGLIESKVSQTDFESLEGRVGTAESTISQHAGLIESRVTSTTFTTEMAKKEDNVYKQSTAPSHSNGRLWLDTSKTPNVLYRSNGTSWVKATPTTPGEVGAYSATDGSALAGRVSTAESTISQHAGLIQSKVSQTDFESLEGRVDTAESTISQHAGLIESKVSSTTFTTEMNKKENNIHKSNTAPSSPAVNQLWLDTTYTVHILKRWDGSKWAKVTPTQASEVGAYSASAGVALAGRVSTAESTISQHADLIESRVTSTTFTTELNKKEDNVYKQTTAPSHSNGRLWLDTSKTPNILYRSTGSSWVKATPTTPGEVGAYSASDGNALAGRVSTAESTISQHAGQIQSKVSQTDFNTLSGRVSTAESTITQQAGLIESKVEKNGVISAIRQTAETVKIQASKVEIDGDLTVTNGMLRIKSGIITNSMIASNASIDFAKIANVRITDAHISNGTIDFAKIKNVKITDAMIQNLSADKINGGVISGIKIQTEYTGKPFSHIRLENGELYAYGYSEGLPPKTVAQDWHELWIEEGKIWGRSGTLAPNTTSKQITRSFEIGKDGGIFGWSGTTQPPNGRAYDARIGYDGLWFGSGSNVPGVWGSVDGELHITSSNSEEVHVDRPLQINNHINAPLSLVGNSVRVHFADSPGGVDYVKAYVDGGQFRIEQSNNLLQIGTGTAINDRNAYIQSRHNSQTYATAVGNLYLNPAGGNVYIGKDVTTNFYVNGTVYHKGLTAWSMRELKKDISNFEQDATGIIQQIPIYEFRYKADNDNSPIRLGTIYEESPKYIKNREGGIEDSKIIYLLVKAVQEQQKTLEELANKIIVLESLI